MNPSTKTATDKNTYKGLYRLSGIAAVIVVVLTLSEVVAFMFIPQPSTIEDWFALYQGNKLFGLIGFWGLEVPMYGMFILVFFALYLVLKDINQGQMAVALILVLLGAGIFFATNNPFTMLSLSNQYAAATTDAQRSVLLAAGHAVLANTSQRAVGGFNIGLFLVTIAGLLVSSTMLRNTVFNRTTAYLGILAYALSLADYLRQALTSSALIALLVIMPHALLLVIWFALVGRRLMQLGKKM